MNLANKVTLSRFPLTLLLLIAYFISFFIPAPALYVIPMTHITILDLVCCVVFIIIASTDGVDGHIARSRNMVTDFGKYMDPLADKFLIDGTLIMLTAKMPWLCPPLFVVLLVGRDFIIDGLRMVCGTKGVVIPANIFGKAKTVAETVYIPFLFLRGFPFQFIDYVFDNKNFMNWTDGTNGFWAQTMGCNGEISAMLWLDFLGIITVLLSLISGGIYIYNARKVLKESAK